MPKADVAKKGLTALLHTIPHQLRTFAMSALLQAQCLHMPNHVGDKKMTVRGPTGLSKPHEVVSGSR
jgi:hypothetical protein